MGPFVHVAMASEGKSNRLLGVRRGCETSAHVLTQLLGHAPVVDHSSHLNMPEPLWLRHHVHRCRYRDIAVVAALSWLLPLVTHIRLPAARVHHQRRPAPAPRLSFPSTPLPRTMAVAGDAPGPLPGLHRGHYCRWWVIGLVHLVLATGTAKL